MKIGLIGAPGSGKSDLAHGLRAGIGTESGGVGIVDDYVLKLEATTDQRIGGTAGTYIGNLLIAVERYDAEIRDHHSTVITCGTLVETIVYESINAVEAQDESSMLRMQAFNNLMGLFFRDTFEYDHLFVLPHPSPDPLTIAGKVNRHLADGLDTVGVEFTTLTGSPEERLIQALKEIG